MSDSRDVSPPAPTVRRRGEVLTAAIHEATYAELLEHGYTGVTFEGVARRARTSKPVLYRRYRSRAHMVVDAIPAKLRAPWAPGESLREDLMTLLCAALDENQHMDSASYRSLIAEFDDGLLDANPGLFAAWADQTVFRALSAARDRSEIGAEEIPYRAATSILALLRSELLFTREAIYRETIADMLDTVYLPLITALSPPPPAADQSRGK